MQKVTKRQAIERLREHHAQLVTRIAEKLRRVDLSRLSSDDQLTAGWDFAMRVAKPLVAPTEAEALLTIALAKHNGELAGVESGREWARETAAVAATLDAAEQIGARWYLRQHGVKAGRRP